MKEEIEKYQKELQELAAMSNRYGSNAAYVLAGGGNTSFKCDSLLWIKGSGTSLATIQAADFVVLERALLGNMWNAAYPASDSAREAAVLADMMDARIKGENRRPSVETLLHDLFPQRFVLHVHPALVNGLTCSAGAAALCAKLFPEAVWIDACKPGFILAEKCRKAMQQYKEKSGKDAEVLFLQNHGIFFAGNSVAEIDKLVAATMEVLEKQVSEKPDFTPVSFDRSEAVTLAPVLRALYGDGKPATVRFSANQAALAYDTTTRSLSPDHIVYTKARQLVLPAGVSTEGVKDAFDAFVKANGYKPKVVFVPGLGMFSMGKDIKEAATVEAVMQDAISICVYAKAFGGVSPMPEELIDFIVNWEVESYRSKVSLGGEVNELACKVAIVTGGAQGFGKGIADEMFKKGAYLAIADMNPEGAAKAAADYGIAGFAVAANVSDEDSVRTMVEDVVLHFGGIDVLINNAGIAKAGGLDVMDKKTFELVTAVNYTGYFLCAKYVSAVMKLERSVVPAFTADIIAVNSKSGLEGSNKNFAYAGSKFGGIGLTQSFALELAPHGIKVNAVCPGNYLNGPLWSDPERGLFVQYLKAGKVPGAQTVEDVRKYYEAKVPMGRGCEPSDVAKAIFYLIDQPYETGQALPVTGGQIMLN